MKIIILIMRELIFRRINFVLGSLTVAAAAILVTGTFRMFHVYDLQTRDILIRKQEAIAARMQALRDEYRKITKGMGFNVLILPKEQNLSELYSDDFASKYMPEAYARKLADSRIMSVRHLLPSLTQKVIWPESKRTIILTGVRGEVPLMHRNPRKPIMQPVPKGTIVLGHELCESLEITQGNDILLLGKRFKVSKCHEERGNKDDITAWIDLTQAQSMFDKKGKINAILALECRCVADSALSNIARIRKEIQNILPQTQVIEFMSKVLTRAEARHQAFVTEKQALAAEKEHRLRQKSAWETIASVLLPIVIICAVILIGFISLNNARTRRSEVALLRTMGFRKHHVLILFLGKALFMGILGGALGFAVGELTAGLLVRAFFSSEAGHGLNVRLFLWIIIFSPVLTIIASWIPAFLAAEQDPAAVLRKE